jgi:hypothetical protein
MAATYYGPKRNLQISDDDLIWAGRGLIGEEGSHPSRDTMAGLLWAIMHRCLLLNSKLSYGDMWKWFSTATSPKWRRGGEKCGPGGVYETNEECSEAKLKRRATISQLGWDDFPQPMKCALLEFQNGVLFPPDDWSSLSRPRVSNWYSGKSSTIRQKYPWGILVGSEWAFEDSELLAGNVTVDSDRTPIDPACPMPSKVPKVLLGIGILGLATYLAWRAAKGF